MFEAHPSFTLTKIEPAEDLTTVTVGNRRLEGLKFSDVIQWTVYDTGYPSGLSSAEKTELRLKMGQKLDNHWLTFEMPMKVSIGGGAAKEFGVVLNTSFNVDSEPIVCNPRNAIATFAMSGMDALAIGDFILEKPVRG